jgi:hypothetical protein
MGVIQPAMAIETLVGKNGFALETATQRHGSATNILMERPHPQFPLRFVL